MNNTQVAHNWGNSREGKGSNYYSVESNGAYLLKSYCTIIGINFNDVAILCTDRYSNSTCKHQNYAKQAVNNLIPVPVRLPQWYTGRENYLTQIAKDLIAHIDELIANPPSVRAKMASHNHELNIAQQIVTLRKIAELIDNQSTLLPHRFACRSDLDALIEKSKELAEDKRKKQANQEKKDLNDWLQGKNNKYFRSSAIHLRINEDRVETSQGAFISLEIAKKLFPLIVAKSLNTGDAIESYRFNKFTDKEMIIGCHAIPLSEVDRLAKQLNLIA